MIELPPGERRPVLDPPPPFLRTWPRVYIGVLFYLAFVIVSLYLFSRLVAP